MVVKGRVYNAFIKQEGNLILFGWKVKIFIKESFFCWLELFFNFKFFQTVLCVIYILVGDLAITRPLGK